MLFSLIFGFYTALGPSFAAASEPQKSPLPCLSGIINHYTPVTGFGCDSSTLHIGTLAGFNAGDKVLLIQMQVPQVDLSNTASFGTLLNTTCIGNYEFNRIQSIAGGVIQLQFGLTRPYDLSGKVQLVRVPEYDSAMVCGITCLPWDGSIGGVLALDVKNQLELSGNMDVSGKGFRGGKVESNSVPWVFGEQQFFYPPQSTLAAEKGEGLVQIPVDFSFGRGRAGNGGGGGNAHNGGGGGGANGGSGGNGVLEITIPPASPTPNTSGIGGQKYFDAQNNKIMLGGGAGAGHANDQLGTSGGAGGGIVFVSAGSIQTNNFRILANGTDVFGGPEQNDGQGGGGAGGTVLLQVAQVAGTLNCELKGGSGGSNPYTPLNQVHGPGGGGGGGKLLLAQNTPNVVSALQGGSNGFSSLNLANGATPGEWGKMLVGFTLPEGDQPAHPVSSNLVLSVQSPLCSGQPNGQIAVLQSTALAFNLNGGPWQSDSVFSNLMPGTYQVGLQFSGGCTLDTVAVLNAVPPVIDSLLSISDAGCIISGSIEIAAISGTAPFEFQINGGAWQATGAFLGLVAGDYSLTLRDAGGCTHTSNYTVNGAPPALDSLLSINASTCVTSGEISVAAVSGTAPFEFQINGGPWQPSGVFSNLPAGNYSVTMRDGAGCTNSENYIVDSPPLALDSLLSIIHASCAAGGSISVAAISGTAPFEFQINGGAWQSSGVFSNLLAGNYSITMRDGAGCTSTEDYLVDSPPPALDSLVSIVNATCVAGGTISVAAISGTTPFEFQINSGAWQPSGVFSDLPAGNYSIAMRDGAGCIFTENYVVESPPLALDSLVSIANATCVEGGAISVAAISGTAPFEFQINGGIWQPSGVFSDLPAGNYTVAMRDGAGCTNTDDYIVNPPPSALDSLISIVNASCVVGGSISVAAISGTAPFEFQINGSVWQPSGIFSDLPAGNYSVTMRDGAGCTQTENYIVNPPPLALDSLVVIVNATCVEGGAISVAAISGTAPFEFQINGGIWQPSGIFSNLPAGNYSVIMRDEAGCTDSSSYQVAGPPFPMDTLESITHATCVAGGAVSVNALSGTAPFEFQINGGPWQSSGVFSNLPAGNYSILLRDAAGCTDLNSYIVNAPPPVLDSLLSLVQPTCTMGGTIALAAISGTAPFEFQINSGPWQSSAVFSGLTAGNYSSTLRDAAGCIHLSTFQIQDDEPLILQLDSIGNVDCRHPFGFVAVSASGGTGTYAYQINNGSGPTPQGYFPALSADLYAVTVTDSMGCITILNGLPVLELIDSVVTQETVTIYEGGYYQLPDGNRTDTPGQYPFLYETVKGCDSLHLIDLLVLKRNIYVPNVFHPNDDGTNDYFTVYADASLEKVEQLSVFDRWGEWIYWKENLLPNDEENGWDGNFRGQPVNPGVFVWVAKLRFKDGLQLVLSGNVTVIR